MSYSLAKLNGMSQTDFVEALGGVFENSDWVAAQVALRRPFSSLEALSEAMNHEVADAPQARQLALLRAHPDLGTSAKISTASTAEQTGAGLDQLTQREYEHLLQLNTGYKERFGFPFLFAVKGSGKGAIIHALETRIHSTPEAEFAEALRQVYRIARFRLEGIITE